MKKMVRNRLGGWPVGAVLACAVGGALLWARPAQGGHPKGDEARPVPPPAIAKGVQVLFSGKAEEVASNWVQRGGTQPAAWKISGDAMVAGGGDIMTKQAFADFQLHIEFKTPFKPEAHGQARGNSGVIIYGRYEVQVLDSFGLAKPGTGDCGALYSLAAPLTVASKPPREWQTYDIVFRRPRFADGKKTENGRVTVIQNGMVVLNNQEIIGPTADHGKGFEDDKPGNIVLQDHHNPVEYRNVWVLPLPDKGSEEYDGH